MRERERVRASNIQFSMPQNIVHFQINRNEVNRLAGYTIFPPNQ